jgi:hypothetical protein
MKIKSGSLDPDPDLFFVNTGPGDSNYYKRNTCKVKCTVTVALS